MINKNKANCMVSCCTTPKICTTWPVIFFYFYLQQNKTLNDLIGNLTKDQEVNDIQSWWRISWHVDQYFCHCLSLKTLLRIRSQASLFPVHFGTGWCNSLTLVARQMLSDHISLNYSIAPGLLEHKQLRFYELNGSVLCWKWWSNGECYAALLWLLMWNRY